MKRPFSSFICLGIISTFFYEYCGILFWFVIDGFLGWVSTFNTNLYFLHRFIGHWFLDRFVLFFCHKSSPPLIVLQLYYFYSEVFKGFLHFFNNIILGILFWILLGVTWFKLKNYWINPTKFESLCNENNFIFKWNRNKKDKWFFLRVITNDFEFIFKTFDSN